MKKLLFFLGLTALAAYVGCGSKDVPVPAPPPSQTYYTVTAYIDGGSGTISPSSVSVLAGNEISFQVSPKPGWRISTAFANVSGTTVTTSGNVVTLGKVNADMEVHVILTDSLTPQQLEAMKNLLVGKWQTVLAYRINPGFLGIGSWDTLIPMPCVAHSYYQYNSDGSWVYVHEAGSCTNNNYSGTWSISVKGDSATFTDNADKTDISTAAITITADTLTECYPAKYFTDGQIYLYKSIGRKN